MEEDSGERAESGTEYPDVAAAAEKLAHVSERVLPEPELAEMYDRKYEKWSRFYPALKDIFFE